MDRKTTRTPPATPRETGLQQRLLLLTRLSVSITSNLDLSTVLQEIVDAACQLTQARYGALGIFDASGLIQQFITHGVTPEQHRRIGELPRGRGILAELHRMQHPLRLDDLSQHPRSVGFPPHHPPMRTFLGTPIRFGNTPLGNLYLTEKVDGRPFTQEDEDLLVLFAAQAAVAVRNAQLQQQVRQQMQQLEDLAAERLALLRTAQQEKARLEALVETSPVGVLVVDGPTHRVTLANREAQRILGVPYGSQGDLAAYRRGRVYRRPDGSLYQHKDLPLQRALDHGETVRAEEVVVETPDGHQTPTLVNAMPVYGPDGSVTGAIAVTQDITPLREAEKFRNEFLGMVSHELRTPLTAIKGGAATALGSHRPLDPLETRELFEIINEQADRLRDMVDNLLDMARIEGGTFAISPEPVDLREVLDQAVRTFTRAGGLQEVRVEAPEGPLPVHADRRRILQVLSNLLANAGKFSPPNAPIALRVQREAAEIRVHVHDQGRGIPREKLPYLFRKFTQVHEDSGRRLAGTGLGLAICKGIVEAHGGRIWADSPGEGHGATFSFSLPLAQPTAQPAVSVAHRAHHLGRVAHAGARARVLAVDDEPEVLRYLHRTLHDAGYHVAATGDPDQVLPLVEAEGPDLVLLDVMLGPVSGFDLLQRIRKVSGVPVIFVTARGASEEVVRALQMGADDYVVKPFAPSELLARIEAALRRRVAPDQMEARPPLVLDGLTIDFTHRQVTVDGQPVALSATEYKLLYELARHAGMVLTHDQLLQRVWGPEYSGQTELVRSFIRNLRRKLGDDAQAPRYILTERQIGYRLRKP